MKNKKPLSLLAALTLILSLVIPARASFRFGDYAQYANYAQYGIYANYGIYPANRIFCKIPGAHTNQPVTTPAPVRPTVTPAPPQSVTTPGANNNNNNNNSVTNYESEVARLVNEIRVQYGLNSLVLDAELSRVARYKSQDMRDKNYFDHTSPTYGTPFQMMKSFGISYRTAGENIAYGYATPQAVVDGWMNSPGHRANILNASYTKIGVGYIADGHYWTQMFIG